MHPRLFEIPIIHLTIHSFGPMMVVGSLMGLFLTRRLSRRAGLDLLVMTNAVLYAVIVGVVGARVFFVIHYFDHFRDNLLAAFAMWRGGLEFIGGVVPATIFLILYLRHLKLPYLRYLDILAMALLMGLAFGRIGCFLNGCCFGKPTDLPWAMRFPYGSFAYISQINPDPARDRYEPHLKLPKGQYLSFYGRDGRWYPKPLEELTEQQRYEVTRGKYRCLPIHPTQLYSFANALLLCGILYLFWRQSISTAGSSKLLRRIAQPGSTVALTLVLYGPTRFFLESVRDDNPYEFASLTISQILGVFLIIFGVLMLVVLPSRGPDSAPGNS